VRPGAVLCERDNSIVRIRGDRGTWSEPQAIRPYDSMLSEFADPRQAPDALDQAIDLAFPGSRISVEDEGGGRLGLRLHQHGLLRPLSAAELSDGTLRYLLWAAALLAPRPAGLLVLNEPETSLHWQLLVPLAQLITAAAARSQIIAVSHSQTLINALHRATEETGISASTIELIKDFGETSVAGREPLDGPAWRWPKR